MGPPHVGSANEGESTGDPVQRFNEVAGGKLCCSDTSQQVSRGVGDRGGNHHIALRGSVVLPGSVCGGD